MPTAFALRRRRHFRPDADPRPPTPEGMMYFRGELTTIETVEQQSRRRMGAWDMLPRTMRLTLHDSPNEPRPTTILFMLNEGVPLDASGKQTKKRYKQVKLSLEDI